MIDESDGGIAGGSAGFDIGTSVRTFASQKLLEEHGHRLSAETLRGWMIEDGLWRPKARREVREHPREHLGTPTQGGLGDTHWT